MRDVHFIYLNIVDMSDIVYIINNRSFAMPEAGKLKIPFIEQNVYQLTDN